MGGDNPRFPGGRLPAAVHAFGFSARKLGYLRQFMSPAEVVPVRSGAQVPAGSVLALWGSAPKPAGLRSQVDVLRVEDGFLRSVGLGADLVRPVSWVIDPCGMYYDPARPSRLEMLLALGAPDETQLARAAALRQRVVAAGLTKYNLTAPPWQRPSDPRRVVLVAGQVASDASIAHGAGRIRSNLELVRAVRDANPDACVVYKPHPDLVAGLRSTDAHDARIAGWCDEVVVQADMAQLLSAVDEVHVMTSLGGFEALLRGRAVTTYGSPFYAGWGLTTDLDLHPDAAGRRTRRLSLDELVHAALIAYPSYVSPSTGALSTPEAALADLLAWRSRQPAALPAWRRALRPLLRLAARWHGR